MALTLPFLRTGFSLPFWPNLVKAGEPAADGARMQRHEPTLDVTVDLEPEPRAVPEAVVAMLNQAAQAIEDLQNHQATMTADAGEVERSCAREVAEIEAAIDGLQRETRERASRVRDLEIRQAAADQVVADLRARLACMERKLTSSLKTARYQAMTQELAEQAPLDLASVDSPLVQTAAA